MTVDCQGVRQRHVERKERDGRDQRERERYCR